MTRNTKMGARVRSLRVRDALSQVDLANRLGISPSYLNLIEHDQRPLTAPLLLKVAQLFHVELQAHQESDEVWRALDRQWQYGNSENLVCTCEGRQGGLVCLRQRQWANMPVK